MALLLDMQQTMLRDSARDFLQREAPVSQLRDLRDTRHPDGLSRPLWKEFGLMGFAGTLLPDAHGGLDLGVAEAAVVMEEIGRNLSASPFWSTSVVCASALRLGGSEAQQRTHLPMVGSGESVIALARPGKLQ